MHFLPFRVFLRTLSVGLLLLLPVWVAKSTAQSPTAFQKAWQSGTPASVTGVLTVLYADDFTNRRAELMHSVRDERTGRTFQLRFEAGAPGQLRSGARVTARGRAQGSEIYLAAVDGSGLTIQTNENMLQQTAASTSEHQTLVMVANFRDANVSCTVQSITDMMFTDPNGRSVAALYSECSLGRVVLSGDVVGPYALTFASTDPCDLASWTSAIDTQATAAGVNVGAYRHKVYVLPPSQCIASGLATVGGNPSGAWIFRCNIVGVFGHELGHNLGMDHASTPTSEFDDSTDPMAMAGTALPGVNAPHRQQLGWHTPEGVRLVEQAGVFEVAPLALDPAAASAPQILMIRKPDTAEYYYLSYRTPLGFDRFIDGVYHYRLNVHRYKGDGSSVRTFRLAGLADGESFVDQANGVTVTMVSHGSASATASVTFAAVATAPSVAVSPSAQSGTAGSSRSYAVAVTNQDSPAWPASTFSLNSTAPTGWSATVSPASLLILPGATGQATVTVSSAPGALVGTYVPTLNVSDVAQPLHAASANMTFTVEPQADRVPPSAPSGLIASASQKLKQIGLSWQAASDNVGVVSYRVWRNGVMVGVSAGTSWNDTAVIGGTPYTYSVEARDAAGNVSAASNSVTASLGGGRRK